MRIGVLAGRAGLTAKTIRFYEEAGLLPGPPRTPAGYRDYPDEAITRLAFIRDAQSAGLALAEIRGILAIRDAGQAPCHHVSSLIDHHLAQIEQRLADLAEARDALRELKLRASATEPDSCPADQVCSILSAGAAARPLAARRPPAAGLPGWRNHRQPPAAPSPGITRPLVNWPVTYDAP